jgi:hypothetical protein
MKLNLSAGLAAGLIAISAAPAVAASPATVNVRVEGASQTLVDTTSVTTTAQPVSKAGHDCSGTSAGGALDRATAGNWNAGYFDTLGHYVTAIMGEDYSASTSDGWTVFVNHRAISQSPCLQELGAGDDVVYFVSHCEFDASIGDCSNAPVLPLGLIAPATVQQGASAQVTVIRYDVNGTTAPVPGASVGGAVTDADGHATIAFPASGTVRLKAEKPGFARSEAETVAVGAVGAQNPPLLPADRTPPTAKLAGLEDHAVLRTGPRELRGSFSDSSAIKTIKLRLTKRLGKKCWYFSGRSEKFRGSRCGKGPYFAIEASGRDWSYLLPSRLGKGRYVLDAVAIDGAGNRTPLARGTTRVVFTVR